MEVPTRTTRRVERAHVKVRNQDRERAILGWWVGTVVLTLFPTLVTIFVIALQENKELSLELIFGDGEICLASFLIVASTLMSGHSVRDKTVYSDLARDTLLLLGAVQLVSYTTIKTNDQNNMLVVTIFSFSALFLSICISWVWYQLVDLSKEVYNDKHY